MSSLFTLANSDQSAYYLGQLFGSVGSVLQPMGSGTLVLNLMGTLFQTLNTTALIVGSLLIMYTTVVGLLKTAQEGEFLGKQWSSLWVPLRMVIGIAALFPTGGGYSVIQIVFMWIIMQGVAAGDSLWTTAINFINTQGSPYATITTPNSVGTQQNIESLYQALVCADAARRADGSPVYPNSDGSNHSYYYCTDHGPGSSNADSFCDTSQTPLLSVILSSPNPAQTYNGLCSVSSDGSVVSSDGSAANNILTCNIGPGYNSSGACGSISLGNYSGITNNCSSSSSAALLTGTTTYAQCQAYQAQQQELAVIVGTLELLAKQTNQFDHDYLVFYENRFPFIASMSQLSPQQQAAATMAIPPPPAPLWIQRHCNDVNLSEANCCIYNNYTPPPPPASCNSDMPCSSGTCSSSTTASGTCSVPPGPAPAPTTCLTPDPNTGLFAMGFAADSSSNSSVIDYGNSSQTAAQSLLFMCGLAPYTQTSYSATGCMTVIAKPQGSTPPTVCSSTSACPDGSLCTSSSSTPGVCIFPGAGDFITGQVNNYNQALNATASASLAAASQALSAGTNSSGLDYGTIQDMGWMMAGGYYYELAKQSNSNLQAAYPPFTVTILDPGMDSSSPLNGYRNNVEAAQYIVDKITGQSTSSFSGNSGASRVISKQQQASQGILGNFMGNLTGGANPLVGMQQMGEALILTAQALFAVIIVLVAIAAAVFGINFMVLGTGIASNPAAAAWNFLGWTLFGGVMALCGWCITIGGMLSVYTPLIPYTIFTFGVIGWFFSVIEAMTAAPFVALGILSPGGQHDLLGRAEPAMLLLANIFLRPTLMVMGMMASMLFANVIVAIVNAAFTGVMSDIYGSGTPDLISLIMFISAYAMLIIGVLNKTYALIDVVPDKILVWLGGHAGQGGGASETLGQMKGGVEAAGAAAGGAMKGAAAAGKGASDAAVKAEGTKMALDAKVGGGRVGDVNHLEGVQGPQQRPDGWVDHSSGEEGPQQRPDGWVDHSSGEEGPQQRPVGWLDHDTHEEPKLKGEEPQQKDE